MSDSVHLDFDSAWDASDLPMQTLDFRDWGPRLRYFCSGADIASLSAQLPRDLPRFLLYGSGDFHHLSSLWLKRAIATAGGGRVTVISFDNHPDWDRRPPKLGCGGWINRALDLSEVEKVHVWGCGNFELAMPSRLFANHAALRSGRLVVHPWAERMNPQARERFDCMAREGWRYAFEQFAAGLVRRKVYITVDLDCLAAGEAATNWENGIFTASDIAWAIEQIRARGVVVGGDVCGAYSPPQCTGMFRKFAVWWDHPKLPATNLEQSRRLNAAALKLIWPALCRGDAADHDRPAVRDADPEWSANPPSPG